MGHHDLRHDKECQNCGHTVEVEYCSKCGQQNTETRQSFHHLVTHIIEDITHYDGNFWKTIKYLLFRPGKLTTEYMLGHRMRYVPPVKLYIFISFVCFFTMALMAPEQEEEHTETHKKSSTEIASEKAGTSFDGQIYHTVHEYDSIQNSRPEIQKLPWPAYYIGKAVVKLGEKKVTRRSLIITTSHTLPKVLFIYMPIFAFWLWLFHGKKRWYFFDHGIFTLHYFSFLLLLIIIEMITGWASLYIGDKGIIGTIIDNLTSILTFACMLYSFFYFFRSHRKFYGETKAISRIKSFALFWINFIIIIVITVATLIYVILNSH